MDKADNTLLTLVIVNWNVINHLCSCLDSIKACLHDIRYEVIVVDNASIDDSIKILKKRYSWVKLIINKENQGFARANNQGFKVANGKYLLILNPDTVVQRNSIQNMIKILDANHTIGMVGPRVVDGTGNVVPACKRKNINLLNIFLHRFLIVRVFRYICNQIKFLKKIYFKTFFRSGTTQCIQGSCMLVRRNDLDLVGYFDENIPMYLDDIDLCYRFIKAGFTIYYCAESEIKHFHGASTKKSEQMKLVEITTYQAADAFFNKHKSLTHIIIHHVILFFSSLYCLLIDFIILPIAIFTKRNYILALISKHYCSLLYSISFKMKVLNFQNYEAN